MSVSGSSSNHNFELSQPNLDASKQEILEKLAALRAKKQELFNETNQTTQVKNQESSVLVGNTGVYEQSLMQVDDHQCIDGQIGMNQLNQIVDTRDKANAKAAESIKKEIGTDLSPDVKQFKVNESASKASNKLVLEEMTPGDHPEDAAAVYDPNSGRWHLIESRNSNSANAEKLRRLANGDRDISLLVADPNDPSRLRRVNPNNIGTRMISQSSLRLLHQANIVNQMATALIKSIQERAKLQKEVMEHEKQRLEADMRRQRDLSDHAISHLKETNRHTLPHNETYRDLEKLIGRCAKELQIAMQEGHTLHCRQLHRGIKKANDIVRDSISRKDEIRAEEVAADAKKTDTLNGERQSRSFRQYRFIETNVTIAGGLETNKVTKDATSVLSVHRIFLQNIKIGKPLVPDQAHLNGHDIHNGPNHHVDRLVA